LIEHAQDALRATRPAGTLVLVELPGWRDAQGHSPFWHGLVRHFAPLTGMNMVERLGASFTSHLGPLLPRQMIHGALLSPETQAVLGQPAASSLALQQALKGAGFSDWRHVRIDDGGPVWARPL
jgi:arginine N-succinyltransferase